MTFRRAVALATALAAVLPVGGAAAHDFHMGLADISYNARTGSTEIVHTYTRQELASGSLPPSEWGLLLAHSYSPNGGWYVMVIPAAYQMQTLSTGGTTHFSPWSYDRHVPLGFFGAPFTPGIYHGRVQPVDLAATLASLLGLTQPSASVGTVLTQALHTVPAVPAPRVTRPAHPEGPPSP